MIIGFDNHNKDVRWCFNHPQISNRNMLITGCTGTGKTFANQYLMLQAIKKGLSVVVFDYSDSYTLDKLNKEFVEMLGDRLTIRNVYFEGIPINPFKVQRIHHAGKTFPEKMSITADRVRDILSRIYKFGEMQKFFAYEACMSGLQGGIDANMPYTNMNMQQFYEILSTYKDPSAVKVLNKITSIVDKGIFVDDEKFDWGSVIFGGSVTIFQLTHFSHETKRIILEFLLEDLWHYAKSNCSTENPFVAVFDEIQLLNLTEDSIISRVLSEGRKFGWSVWNSTQFLSGNFEADESARLQQSALKIYFKQTERDLNHIANQIDKNNANHWKDILRNLSKGQCIALGNFENRVGGMSSVIPVIVKVPPLNYKI